MYKITFNLTSPICFIDRPVFDSILAYAYVKEKVGFVEQKLNLTKEEMIDLSEMPLKLHKDGYFIASQVFFDEAINFTSSWKKRWDNQHDHLVDFKGKNKLIRINQGEFKSYDMPLNLYSIPEVYFVFDSENVKEIEKLIKKHIVGIGKKISQGYGFFKDFSIEEIELNFDKMLLRPIPKDLIPKTIDENSYELKYTAWKPPYWLPDNFELCGVPK